MLHLHLLAGFGLCDLLDGPRVDLLGALTHLAHLLLRYRQLGLVVLRLVVLEPERVTKLRKEM